MKILIIEGEFDLREIIEVYINKDIEPFKAVHNSTTNISDNTHCYNYATFSLDDLFTGLHRKTLSYPFRPLHLLGIKLYITTLVRLKALKGNNTLKFNQINVDLAAKAVTISKQPIKLICKKYLPLLCYIANTSKVVSKNVIAKHLWNAGENITNTFNFIYSRIKNIRKKLLNVCGKDYMQAAYGMVYKFTEA